MRESQACTAPRSLLRPAAALGALLLLSGAPQSAALYSPVAGPNLTSAASLGLPGSSARAAAVTAFTAQAFGPTPANVTLSCALLNLGQAWDNAVWDGYAGFVHPVNPALAAALGGVQPGSLLPLQPGDVDGLLVQVLLQLQAAIGFKLLLNLVTPPVGLLPPYNNSTDPMLIYALLAFNQTCMLFPASTSPTRLLYMRQSVSVLSFGYQAVTTRPVYPVPSTLSRVFFWTKPFAAGVWGMLVASTVAFAAFMWAFERNGSDSFEGARSNGEVAGHALFKSSVALAVLVPFDPETAGGRVAAGVHAFSLLLILASYTANLAATLTTSEVPVQPINGVTDFSTLLPACVRDSTTLVTYLNNTYPAVLASVTPQTTFGLSAYGSADALRGVLAGTCVGALIPSTEAAFIMNQNDTGGAFCPLVPVGSPVGEEVVPFTFAPEGAHPLSLTARQLEAFNLQLALLHQAGSFLQGAEQQFFPRPPRPVCAPQDAADAAAQAVLAPAPALEPVDLAGAFALQAVGLAVGFMFHVSKALRKDCARGFARLAGRQAKAVDGGGAALPRTSAFELF